MRRRQGVLLAFVLVCATLLTSCAAPWPFPQPTPDPKLPDSQQIFRPQEIGEASGDLETIDPALIEFQTDYDNAQLLFPGLVTLDEHSQPVDWAAQSHEVSSDGLTYTFHLRADMTWSDGTPIDANTFAYAINRSEDPCTGSPIANYLDPIKGATALYNETCPDGATHVADTLIGKSVIASDPQTLTIILNQPAGYFLAALTSPTAWAMPQALVEQYTTPSTEPYGRVNKSTWTDHLADNGGFGGNLYRLTKWDHAGHIEFERNERFWGQKPQLRRIEYTLYKSTDASWADFAAGKGDTGQPPLGQLEAAKRLKGVGLQYAPQYYPTYLQSYGNAAPFDDVRVRQAFSLAIDRQAVAHEIFHDTVQPSMHLIPEGMVGYNAALTDAAGRTGTNALRADLVTARSLASGYAAEKCGGNFASCPPITLFLSNNGGLSAALFTAIKTGWGQAFPGWAIYYAGRHSCPQSGCPPESYAARYSGWLFDYPDPQDILSQVWTTHGIYNAPYRGAANLPLSIPQVDALCAKADVTQSQGARLALYQQAEQLLVAQVAAIPLYQNKTITAVRSRVVNWGLGAMGMTPLSVWQQVYIKR